MLRSSRESGLDSCSHDDELHTSGERGKEEEDEGARSDDDEEQRADVPPGGDSAAALEPTGVEDLEEQALTPPGDRAEERGGATELPECSGAATSRRPRLSRMDRVESNSFSFSSSSSSSVEEERVTCCHRWVLLQARGAQMS